ncbi:hypothetical protein EPA93_39560 [Ktedonosporobacter rubrisoli]|uniref:AAA domain-containing protein n=1 Tax=Ktedonosporobacter rubrisoli TaxID=2509675 RepID=A0A4P6K0S9_KTERU|nr:AAA family ATPase [Ktedonosporobacter rubrisoli]QBD81747.1 hypothetical protein EPA93_39560 [Ktedonosporobacter rubrisoli]
MELKAYLEGIGRKWWLLGLVALLSWSLGGMIASNQTPIYTSSVAILLNDRLLANTAFPSGMVQLNIPTSSQQYQGKVVSPAILRRIMKTYPHLNEEQLKNNISVSTDQTNQILLIHVNDISPYATADIANFLASMFVKAQTDSIQRQMSYYNQWLQETTTRLNDQINKLNLQIEAATPPQPQRGPAPALTPAQKVTLTQYQSQVNQDRHALYNYQQSLLEVQHALPMIAQTYSILQKADIPEEPTVLPLPGLVIQGLVLAAGLLLTICVLVALDFFTPFVRHKQELLRLAGISVTAEIPQLHPSEQRKLLSAEKLPLPGRLMPLRLLGSAISAGIMRDKGGYTILLSSPRKKRRLATVLASVLAHKGHKTLLVDMDFEHPELHNQLEAEELYTCQTSKGHELSCIRQSTQPNLFLLPAQATLSQGEPLTATTLLTLLPELQHSFDLIILDAPPVDHPDTHILISKVRQVLLFVRKRRDSLKAIKMARATCEKLKTQPLYVFLT